MPRPFSPLAACLALSACGRPVPAANPRPLPRGYDFRDIGRLTIDRPALVPGLEYDSLGPSGYHLTPLDKWFRVPLKTRSPYDSLWVWIRNGTVGCVVAYFKPDTDFPALLTRLSHRFGPPILTDSLPGVGQWIGWEDPYVAWNLAGPLPHTHATVILAILQRDLRPSPNGSPRYYSCTLSHWQQDPFAG